MEVIYDGKRMEVKKELRKKPSVLKLAFLSIDDGKNKKDIHKKAILIAMKEWEKENLSRAINFYDELQWELPNPLDFRYSADQSKMKYKEISTEAFFTSHDVRGRQREDASPGNYYATGNYYEAMTKAPAHETGITISDFEQYNDVLFPDKNYLTIYEWNTNWSNYFEAGLEWFGAHMWTVYDSKNNVLTVIGFSTTD